MSSGGYGSGGGYPPGGGYGPPPGGGYGPPPGGGYGPPPGGGYGDWPSGGFGPMPAGMPPGYTPPTGGSPKLSGGVPWEQDTGGLFSRWWETVKACNFETRPFFAAASQSDSGNALTFAIMTAVMFGILFGLLYVLIFAIFGAAISAAIGAAGGRGAAGAGILAAGFGIGIGIMYASIFVVVQSTIALMAPFITGGIHHVILLMFSGIGEGKSFMHTVRVFAYSEGAAQVWMFIPIVGPFIAIIFNFKNLIQGYDETHHCGIGKALLAIFTPILCCCACYGFLLIMGIGTSLIK